MSPDFCLLKIAAEADQSGPDDPVNSPHHYASGGLECIDAIRGALTPAEFRGYCKGNATKYVWREASKGDDQDLAKACWYLNEAQN